MVEREPPYPPPPRTAPADLGRDPGGSIGRRALGLVATGLGVGLYYAAPLAVGGAAVALLVAEDVGVILRIGGFLVLATTALLLLKSYLPRRLPFAGALVPGDEQSTLRAFVERVADDIDARAPRLLLAPTTRLKLVARMSPLALVRGGRWELHVGLWLIQVVTLSEFQALVARTLAPLSRGTFDKIRFNLRALLQALVDGSDALDEVVATRSGSPLVGLAWMVRAGHLALSYPLRLFGRLALYVEREADAALADDLVAVRIAGSDALVHAILRADFAGTTLREIDAALTEAAEFGIVTIDLYAHVADAAAAVREARRDPAFGEPPFLRGPSAGKYADIFEPGAKYHSLVWNGFPPPDVREQVAKREFVAAERDDRPATDLLDDPTALREKLTNLHYTAGLDRTPDVLPMPADAVRRWLATHAGPAFPAECNGCYDDGRLIQPGTAAEREAALAAEEWDDGRLLSTASGLYAYAGERATTWQQARRALDKLMRRTRYQPAGRDRALADDLADDVRKAGRWLAALDKWAYVAHVHMAARLTDLTLHDALLARYESVLRFQPLMDEARETRARLDSYLKRLEGYNGPPPYRIVRDARKEFTDSRKNLQAYLGEAARIRDPLLDEFTGAVPLGDFLYSREGLPRKSDLTRDTGRRLFFAWAEVAAKAAWLHRLGIAALLDLHARILRDFRPRPEPTVAPVVPELVIQPVPMAIPEAVELPAPPPSPPVAEPEPQMAEDVPDLELEVEPVEPKHDWWKDRPA
jgi:hypothetical protein